MQHSQVKDAEVARLRKTSPNFNIIRDTVLVTVHGWRVTSE